MIKSTCAAFSPSRSTAINPQYKTHVLDFCTRCQLWKIYIHLHSRISQCCLTKQLIMHSNCLTVFYRNSYKSIFPPPLNCLHDFEETPQMHIFNIFVIFLSVENYKNVSLDRRPSNILVNV